MEKNKKIWIGAGCSIAILGIAATTGVLNLEEWSDK